MRTEKIGGGLLVFVSVAVPAVLDRSDIRLAAPVVIAGLSVCVALAILGLVLFLKGESLARPAHRTLPASFISALVGRSPADFSVQVRRYDQSAEAVAFETQLLASLQAAGWNAVSFGHDAGTRQLTGTILESGDAQSAALQTLRRELERSKVAVDVSEMAQFPSNFIRVAIGAHRG